MVSRMPFDKLRANGNVQPFVVSLPNHERLNLRRCSPRFLLAIVALIPHVMAPSGARPNA